MHGFPNSAGQNALFRRAGILAMTLLLVAGLIPGVSDVVPVSWASAADAAQAEASWPAVPPRVVNFAALLPLTGDSSQSGQAARVAVEIAVEEINEYFSVKGIHLR